MKRCTFLFMFLYPTLLHTDVIDDLAHALNTIVKTAPDKTQDVGLLGPWLVKNHKDKLVAYDENYLGKGIKLYQIKVAYQEPNECAIHAFRNCLYLMDLVASAREKFTTIYANMVSKQEFEDFVNVVGCKRGQLSDHAADDIIKSIEEKRVTCMPSCIPQNSNLYCKNIISFTYHNEAVGQGDRRGLETEKRYRELLRRMLPQIEPNLSNQVFYDASAIFGFDGDKGFIERIQKFNKNQYDVLAIDMVVWTTMKHGVAFVVHKYNDTIEYIFADSFNIKFNDTSSQFSKNYRATIDKIIAFTSDKDYFNDCLVRYYYASILSSQNRLTAFNSILNELKELKSPLYISKYKSVFCNLIQEEKEKVPAKSKKYDDLLKDLNC